MLKRFSSLVLVLVVGGSVLASSARVRDEHACEMAAVEAMPGMEAMPCCKEDQAQAAAAESGIMERCCITIPRAPGSSGSTYKLRPPSFNGAAVHPALAQSPMALPEPYEQPYSTQVFLPNLQSSYIRNLSLLI